jgi:hypothetical protein
MPFDGTERLETDQTIRIIDHMLEAFGPNGERWIQAEEVTSQGMCLVGALKFARHELHIKHDYTLRLLRRTLKEIGAPIKVGNCFTMFNGRSEFRHEQTLLLAARAIAKGKRVEVSEVQRRYFDPIVHAHRVLEAVTLKGCEVMPSEAKRGDMPPSIVKAVAARLAAELAEQVKQRANHSPDDKGAKSSSDRAPRKRVRSATALPELNRGTDGHKVREGQRRVPCGCDP